MEPLPNLLILGSLLLFGIAYYETTHHYKPQQRSHVQLSNGDLSAARWPLIAMKTTTTPNFIMSLPTYEEDSLRFNITKTGKYYETGLTRTVSEILSTAPAAGLPKAAVIDVGCNAGWYTLYSAAIFREQGSAERQVYCFEVRNMLQIY